MEKDTFIMQKFNPTELIMDKFDVYSRSAFIEIINRAYTWFNTWALDPNNEVLLKYKKKYTRGHLIGFAVEYFAIEAVNSGELPLKAKFCFTKKGFPYLVLFDDEETFELTINQTKNIETAPQHAENRQSRINKFTSEFNLFKGTFEDEDAENKFYFQLTHGYQGNEPNFIGLGIQEIKNTWLRCIDISKEIHFINGNKIANTEQSVFDIPNVADMQETIKELMENE